MKEKKFNLFGSNWKINYVPKVKDSENNWLYGDASGMKRDIRVSLKDDNNKPLPQEEVEIAELHEIMHAIFMAGQYHNCNNDEPLVEWCARCIYSLKKQGIL